MNLTIQLINKIFLKINNISENKLSGDIDSSIISFFASLCATLILLFPLNWLSKLSGLLLGWDKATNNTIYLFMSSLLNNWVSQIICITFAIVMFYYAILYLNRAIILTKKDKNHWLWIVVRFLEKYC